MSSKMYLSIVSVALLLAACLLQLSKRDWDPVHVKAAAIMEVLRRFDKAGEAVSGKGELIRDRGSNNWKFVGQERTTRVQHYDIAEREIEDVGFQLNGHTVCEPFYPNCNKIRSFKAYVIRTKAVLP